MSFTISEFIEKLQQCPKLQTVILRGNLIQIVTNVENCHQLWRLDLGNNKVSSFFVGYQCAVRKKWESYFEPEVL